MKQKSRLGVNIDHVATLRNQRGTAYPDIVQAAKECIAGGAEQITVHLREDRRHIRDQDVLDLRRALVDTDLNLEMAASDEMLHIALNTRPQIMCLVPEHRQERTTEGGLDIPSNEKMLAHVIEQGFKNDIKVSLFIEPEESALVAAKQLGAWAVELHTGGLCLAHQSANWDAYEAQLLRLQKAITLGQDLGLVMNAGHGIDYEIAPKLAEIDGIYEYNIGHAIVCEAVFTGLKSATARMRQLLN